MAKDLGVADVGSFAEMLEAARADGRAADLLKPLKSLVEQFTAKTESPSMSDLGERFTTLVTGPSGVEERRVKAEMALLRRIEELSRNATVDGVLYLASAYARLRATGPDQVGEIHLDPPAGESSATR
jgi:hypothetical protein